MSIVVHNASETFVEVASETTGSKTFNHTVVTNKGDPRAILVCVGMEGVGDGGLETCSGVTLGGIAMENLVEATNPLNNYQHSYIFGLFHGDAPAAGTRSCVVTFANMDANGISAHITVVEISGVDDYISYTNTYGADNDTTASLNLTASMEDSLLFCSGSCGSPSVAPLTYNSSQSVLREEPTTQCCAFVTYRFVDRGTFSQSVTFAASSARTCIAALVLSPYRSSMAKFGG